MKSKKINVTALTLSSKESKFACICVPIFNVGIRWSNIWFVKELCQVFHRCVILLFLQSGIITGIQRNSFYNGAPHSNTSPSLRYAHETFKLRNNSRMIKPILISGLYYNL